MPSTVPEADRELLQQLATRKMRPSRRQIARILLGWADGEDIESLSIRVGVTKQDIATLVGLYTIGGLEGVGLKPERRRERTITKTEGVIGGDACVAGTRIPIWLLVEARQKGATEAQILLDFPSLEARHLAAAWDYAETHQAEIEAAIHENETA